MRRCVANKSLVPTSKVQATIGSEVKFMSQIKHNKKVCREQEFGSYVQGQGHNRVRGQMHASAITQKLLKQI